MSTAAVHAQQQQQQQHNSLLWGAHGENWSPQSRLPDFSFAGYHFGEDPLPDIDITANVCDFGAIPDDDTDDTQAFKDAIATTDHGAILIPAGRYIISDILWIEKPNIVLRGQGAAKSILVCTKSLEDVRPNMSATTSGRPTSGYSWSGGFIWVKGNYRMTPVTPITSESTRGDRTVSVADTEHIPLHQPITITLHDDENKTLLNHLYTGDPGDTRKVTKPITVRFVTRLTLIDGHGVTIERPLRWDIRPEWKPEIRTFNPTVSEVGIEHLGFEFPNRPYKGHFTEFGANAIAINNAANCWVRNVRINNCDSGVFLTGMFCTIDNLVIESARTPIGGTTGHHGVIMGTDNLMTNFTFNTHFIHDITVSYTHAGNVVKNGRGTNLSFDHHKKANHENLFCNIDVGAGTEMWRCGGGASLGKHCGARTTFWCIRANRDQTWPRASFGPDSMNLVGVRMAADTESLTDPDSGKWIEPIPPNTLQPADLHAAQLERRLR
ncbi:MAG: hypothetical protein HND57_14035 [Planctomycetes bacterium]|nr:hypothetical protein [Planctomycetota bacterium]